MHNQHDVPFDCCTDLLLVSFIGNILASNSKLHRQKGHHFLLFVCFVVMLLKPYWSLVQFPMNNNLVTNILTHIHCYIEWYVGGYPGFICAMPYAGCMLTGGACAGGCRGCFTLGGGDFGLRLSIS